VRLVLEKGAERNARESPQIKEKNLHKKGARQRGEMRVKPRKNEFEEGETNSKKWKQPPKKQYWEIP